MSLCHSFRGDSLESVITKQKSAFRQGRTESLESRLQSLEALSTALNTFETRLIECLSRDLRKPFFEAYASDIALVLEEIAYCKKNLKSWMKKRRCGTPIVSWPSRSYVEPRPLGQVLVIGPWNYPCSWFSSR